MKKITETIDFDRPASVPARGLIEAFDAGWDAHKIGISLETVVALMSKDAVSWGVCGWKIRALIANGIKK